VFSARTQAADILLQQCWCHVVLMVRLFAQVEFRRMPVAADDPPPVTGLSQMEAEIEERARQFFTDATNLQEATAAQGSAEEEAVREREFKEEVERRQRQLAEAADQRRNMGMQARGRVRRRCRRLEHIRRHAGDGLRDTELLLWLGLDRYLREVSAANWQVLAFLEQMAQAEQAHAAQLEKLEAAVPLLYAPSMEGARSDQRRPSLTGSGGSTGLTPRAAVEAEAAGPRGSIGILREMCGMQVKRTALTQTRCCCLRGLLTAQIVLLTHGSSNR
jgi:hypothetical protein